MSYVYRYEKVPDERCLKVLGYNFKKEPRQTIKEFLGAGLPERFEAIVIQGCTLSSDQLSEINELIKERATDTLWRVHFHRSTLVGRNDSDRAEQFGLFFDLIHEKPLVDLKLDSITPMSEMWMALQSNRLAALCNTNTTIRDKTRVLNLTKLLLIR